MGREELFWNASVEELQKGYRTNQKHYFCLLCGEEFEKGRIFPFEDMLYDAERAVQLHVETEHQSPFDYLIQLDKKITGLTEHQSRLMQLFYQGKSDKEIQVEMGIGSSSTIRNHRFVLKEKERQAKIFLSLMEMMREKDLHNPASLPLPLNTKKLDERFNVTKEEAAKIIKKYFPDGMQGPLHAFPPKEKQRWVILREIALQLDNQKIYTEKELNQELKQYFHDYVRIRRHLIEYQLLDRKADGSQYWIKR